MLSDIYTAGYAEYVCVSFGLSHAKEYLREKGKTVGVFSPAMKARTKERFLSVMWEIQDMRHVK